MDALNRRDLLKAAVAVAVATVVVPEPGIASAQTSLKGRVKKSVIYGMYSGTGSTADKFRTLKSVGFEGLEVSFGDKTDPAEMKAAANTTGLPIHSVILGSVENIPAAVDRAKLLGAGVVLVVAGRVNESTSYRDNYERTQAILREAAPYAEKQDIYLLVENVWNNFLLSPLEMARYVDEIGSPRVQCYFDAGNVVRFGYPEHWIPVLGERIKRVHVKEYCRKKQENEGLWKGFNVEMGEGSIDWEAVRATLTAIGYQGYVTAEVDGGDDVRMRQISEQMDRVLGLL